MRPQTQGFSGGAQVCNGSNHYEMPLSDTDQNRSKLAVEKVIRTGRLINKAFKDITVKPPPVNLRNQTPIQGKKVEPRDPWSNPPNPTVQGHNVGASTPTSPTPRASPAGPFGDGESMASSLMPAHVQGVNFRDRFDKAMSGNPSEAMRRNNATPLRKKTMPLQ